MLPRNASAPVRTIALAGGLAVAALAPPAARADVQTAPTTQQAELRAPARKLGSTVARMVAPTFARARLKSAKQGWRVSPQTAWSGQPQTLLVLDATTREGHEWVKVLIPKRPNGSAGWVPRDRVALRRIRYWIDVRIGARRLTVYRDGMPVRRLRVDVGKPTTPTPHGLAAIWERNRQPDPQASLGPWVLSLTVFSNVLKRFGGGPGRVAIHGRGGTSLRDPLGSARSHGCVRVSNRQVSWMARKIPAGTPVRLRS